MMVIFLSFLSVNWFCWGECVSDCSEKFVVCLCGFEGGESILCCLFDGEFVWVVWLLFLCWVMRLYIVCIILRKGLLGKLIVFFRSFEVVVLIDWILLVKFVIRDVVLLLFDFWLWDVEDGFVLVLFVIKRMRLVCWRVLSMIFYVFLRVGFKVMFKFSKVCK